MTHALGQRKVLLLETNNSPMYRLNYFTKLLCFFFLLAKTYNKNLIAKNYIFIQTA